MQPETDQKVLLSFLKLMRGRKKAETHRIREKLSCLDSDIAQVCTWWRTTIAGCLQCMPHLACPQMLAAMPRACRLCR